MLTQCLGGARKAKLILVIIRKITEEKTWCCDVDVYSGAHVPVGQGRTRNTLEEGSKHDPIVNTLIFLQINKE